MKEAPPNAEATSPLLQFGFLSHNFTVQNPGRYVLYTDPQEAFMVACRNGNISDMQVLLRGGASLDTPDACGVYPLLACLKSLQIDAIRYLSDQIERQGSQAWQLIDLSVLEAQLNTLRPQPLEATGGSELGKHVTYGDLYQCYQVNEAKCKQRYDQRYGKGNYCEASCSVARVAKNFSTQRVMKGPYFLRELLTQLRTTHEDINGQIDAVLGYVKDQFVTASATLGVEKS